MYIPKANTPLSRNIEDYPEGIVIPIDKPYGWTSADAVRKVKFAAVKHFGRKNLKVGHAGTLDPLATGILLICIGNATKQAETLQKHDKEYIAGICFGATTPSYDLEKDIDRRFPYEHIDETALREALKKFIGEQEQVAPLFSAKNIDGARAYELARKALKHGESVPEDILKASLINISSCDLLYFDPHPSEPFQSLEGGRIHISEGDPSLPRAAVRLSCSKGTYIRAFARDLGEELGSGAHLFALCRSRSGDFALENALSVEQASEILS